MAVDAALLEAANRSPGCPVVRVYGWSEPTVTLGYFQKSESHPVPASIAECPRVRRLTGGGAILHHHEITYSVVLPSTHEFRSAPLQLYDVMHTAIAGALSECGVKTGFRAEYPRPADAVAPKDAFLCFLRSDPRDLAMIDGGDYPKIVGSAQRRRRGTILQHGSILMRASPMLPEVLGLEDLHSHFDSAEFADVLPCRLGKTLGSTLILDDFTDLERDLALNNLEKKMAEEPVVTFGTKN